MFKYFKSGHALLVSATIAATAFSVPATAEVELDPEMVNLVIESRYQKPGAEASASERTAAEDELREHLCE